MKRPAVLLLPLLLLAAADLRAEERPVVVGCKKDVEGNALGEIMAQLLEDRGFTVQRRFGLGSTLICFEALRTGAIDVYPEYSGTLEQEILKLPGRVPYTELRAEMKRRHDMDLLPPFGFQNTYAIALKRTVAEEHGLKTIGDLARAPGLRYGFSHEFLERKDGWPGLAHVYGLTAQPVGIAHGLAYEAIQSGKLDVTDVYSTDGDIPRFDLVLLEDDRHYFPEYLAAPLARGGLDSRVEDTLGLLAGRISEARMRQLNAAVVVDGKGFDEVAREFLAESGLIQKQQETPSSTGWPVLPGYLGKVHWAALAGHTITHLKLTAFALLAAMAVAIPLGVLAYRVGSLARPVVYLAGVLQTIPSIALLAFMIPVFDIGAKPAIAALFLYALLPILRNTTTALSSIDPVLRKVAVGMGLTPWQRLRYVELPLAVPTILAGIKTAAVITIGTATLAAFIGAGGLGELIVTGLETKNHFMVLEGAVPAALLALLTEFAFEWLEKLLIPRHLLEKRAE